MADGAAAARGALVVLLGGARSGKSSLAVRWATAYDGPVTFVATGQPGDDEMRDRIRRHRRQRPAGWTTVEEPTDVVGAVGSADPGAFVIVDCLTLWVSNVFDRLDDAAVVGAADALGGTAVGRAAPTVVVSNEVGAGIVPADASTRRYRDLLGGVNAAVVGHATAAYLLVAGRVLALDAPPARPTNLW